MLQAVVIAFDVVFLLFTEGFGLVACNRAAAKCEMKGVCHWKCIFVCAFMLSEC